MKPSRYHDGATLIELIVATTIVAVIVAVLLTAVQSARRAAAKTYSTNNLRQLALATQQFGDNLGGFHTIPDLALISSGSTTQRSIQWHLVDYVHGRPPASANWSMSDILMNDMPHHVPTYIDPSDSTLYYNDIIANTHYKSCYSYNRLVINIISPGFSRIADGSSNTIIFSQHYYYSPQRSAALHYALLTPYIASPSDTVSSGTRRASFADIGWQDVVPVRDPITGGTVASERGLTFQVRPPLDKINPLIPSSPHAAGLPVAMLDGSVRTLSPRIDESTFWSLVTPNWGDVPGDW